MQLLAHCREMIHEYGSIFYDNRGLEIVGLVEEEPLFEFLFEIVPIRTSREWNIYTETLIDIGGGDAMLHCTEK